MGGNSEGKGERAGESWAAVIQTVQPSWWETLEPEAIFKIPVSCRNGPASAPPHPPPPVALARSLAGSSLWKCGLQGSVGVHPKCQQLEPSIIQVPYSRRAEWYIFMTTTPPTGSPKSPLISLLFAYLVSHRVRRMDLISEMISSNVLILKKRDSELSNTLSQGTGTLS